MKNFVLKLLSENLPENLCFHDVDHTLYVLEKVIEIGQNENCTEHEIELLSVAALWHDTGYTITYAGHEQEGCILARRYLPEYGYDLASIDIICNLIMATKIPQSPQNKLEEIIADADLEYLGTDSAASKAHQLFLELQTLNPELTESGWNKMQINFIKQHRYFSNYCNANNEKIKQNYLNQLISKYD
jgi:predicted metal-dependent HD superfamily phosphohydrolase